MCPALLRFTLIFAILQSFVLAVNAQEKAEADSPSAQFDSLRKDFDRALDVYLKRLQGAKGVAEQGKIFREENPQPAFAGRFLELARKHPRDPVGFASLSWIVQTSEFGPAAEKPYSQAITHLATEYADHKDVELMFDRMAISPFVSSGQFLQAVLEKHPSPAVRGRAGFHWALSLKNYAVTVEQLKERADWAKNVEQFVGPELTTQLRNTDTVQLGKKTDEVFARVQKEYPLIAYKKTTLGKAAEAELFEMRHLTVGKLAPDIDGEDTDGKKLKLSDYRGKVVVIVFWGTWCPHCMAMLPLERTLVKRFEGEPFAIVGVNSDENPERLKPVLAKERITWRSFWDGPNSDGPIAKRWNVQGWPVVYVLDPQGIIRFKQVRGEALDAAVNALMKETKEKR